MRTLVIIVIVMVVVIVALGATLGIIFGGDTSDIFNISSSISNSTSSRSSGNSSVVASSVPCHKSGGQIQEKKCCPWYSDDPDHCVTYDDCVCKDGFIGDECEHDCSSTSCPSHDMPVCGKIFSGDEVTFSNKCKFFTSQCNKDYEDRLYFLYDGPCQDHTTCPRYDCPADCGVYYYDNPDHPGCKLCECDPNSPC